MFLIKEQTACSPLGGLGEHWTASPVALDLATARGRSGLPDLEPHLLHLGGSGFCGEEQGLWGVFAGLGLNSHRLQHRGWRANGKHLGGAGPRGASLPEPPSSHFSDAAGKGFLSAALRIKCHQVRVWASSGY